MPEPVNVVVTGAAGQIGYAILYAIAKGDVFGANQPIILRLLDITPMMGSLNGVAMELADCAFPLLKEVIPTDDVAVAFKDVESAFLIGAMPRREGMERKDLLAANVKIFKQQGQALDQHAKKSCKILVVGNPANTNAAICSKYAPSIPKENFSAMTRLDQNRASAQIAMKVGASVGDVKKVIIWGNHSSTQHPDVSHATVVKDGKSMSVEEAVNDMAYLKNEFVTTVQKRGAAVIAARKLSSAMSAAKAACDHMRDWWNGTPEGEWVSMAVLSDGSYTAPLDVIFSFPVTIDANRNWKIVQDLPMSNFTLQKLSVTGEELEEEKNLALSVCQD